MDVDYLIKITECKPLPGYRLAVTCSDESKGVFDMSKYVTRGMYREISTPVLFNTVRLVHGVPTWPGDIDIAPERVRSDMTVI